MKRKKKSGSGLYLRLIASFLVFAVATVILATASLWFTTGSLRAEWEQMDPYQPVDAQGNWKGHAKSFGGWIEFLDGDYRVVDVRGEKKTTKRSYQLDELLLMGPTAPLDQQGEYVGIFLPYDGEKGEYTVMYYPQGQIDMSLNIDLATADQEVTAPFLRGIFLFIGLFILMILLMSRYLWRTIKKPLGYLIDGMERVQSGESGVQIEQPMKNEFVAIKDSFNRMIRQLEDEQEQKRELELSRNRMIMDLSHDLKTPAATIISAATALEDGYVQEDEEKKYYGIIRAKAKRIALYVDEIFTVLKLDHADYPLRIELFDVCELLRAYVAENYVELAQKHELQIDIPEGAQIVQADRELLVRAVANLLDKARKYNQTGSLIGVRASFTKEEYRIEITDDGTLIGGDKADALFGMFERGDRSRKSDGGTGLGLSITQAIAKRHGGTVTYEASDGMNRFTIALPRNMS